MCPSLSNPDTCQSEGWQELYSPAIDHDLFMKPEKKAVIAVTDLSMGGIFSYIENVASALANDGWQVFFLTTHSQGDSFDYAAEKFPCRDVSGINGIYRKILASANLLYGISPDILISNHCSLIHYTLPLLGRHIKPVVVLHSDDQRFYKTASLFRDRIFRWIAPTPGLAEIFKRFIPPVDQRRIRVVPHGIDDLVFSPGSYDRGQSVVFIGFLEVNKGAELLPEIFSRIREQSPGATFKIVGQGPLRARLEEELSARALSGVCAFTGSLDRVAVANVLRESRVMVQPTRIEGFGLILVEAMMCGTVPVVSRLPGVTDFVVSDGKTGLLVAPDDVAGFAERVGFLLRSPGLWHTMGRAAHQEALERFSIRAMQREYRSLFNQNDDRKRIKPHGKLSWFIQTVKEGIFSKFRE
jgi:glycosyltransferase involved in cell wall biosynthesis